MPVAVVTGAAQGIGRRTSEVLAERGYDLALIDLQTSSATAAAIRDHGREALEFTGNVADERSVLDIAAEVNSRWGAADVVVNNAGIALIRAAEMTSAEEFRRVIEINLVAPFLIAKAFAPKMFAKGSGSIVNVAS